MSELECRELVELVTRHLDGVLDGDAEWRFLRHLEACDGCQRYLNQLRHTILLLGRTLARP